jgi:enoyl-CoA hydratase/carnithine racemase
MTMLSGAVPLPRCEEVLLAVDDHVCTITLNRPEKRNALTVAMLDALHDMLVRVAADADVRVLIVEGTGRAFCSGLDLREMAAQRAAGEALMKPIERVLETLEACPQPTIAAMQGDAVAGGCELGLHCDLRVAADDARFTMPVATFGLAPPVDFTWKLIDAIGMAKAKEMLFTGDPISAHEALAGGLVNRVVPAATLALEVEALARRIARNGPLAVRAVKAFAQRSKRRDLPRTDLDELDRRVRMSADLQEGLAARTERRTPVFRGD